MKFTNIFGKIDELNNLTAEARAARWLERTAFVFLTIMVTFAPHSIAVTQSAWLLGMLAWVVRIFCRPRPKFKFTAIDYALWAFFLWSVASSAFSYAPDISLDKLRGVSLFLIFYFVYNNLKTLRAARFLVFALIISAMVGVVWMPLERAIGRGVEVHGLRADSPLLKAAPLDGGLPVSEGKTIVQVGKRKVYSPGGLIDEVEKNETSRLLVYHEDFYSTVELKRADLLSGTNAAERLGITTWERNHSWRAAGFFGHFTTFAEVLQLILSLAFGIFISHLTPVIQNFKAKIGNRKTQIFLLASGLILGLMALALLLTVTRASQFAFFVSACVIVLCRANRKIILAFAAVAVPAVIVGLIYYQQTRNIGFNLTDKSTQYRVMMWSDGTRLWTENARHLVLGVGMDSIKRYWREWDFFDGGREPMGHFHSTPLQLLVERGLPALIIWLTILVIYARTLWRYLRAKTQDSGLDIEECEIRNPRSEIEYGIVLGCFGGLIGFFTSGLVHYNLGDGEVAMVFYLLMGISIFVCDSVLRAAETPAQISEQK